MPPHRAIRQFARRSTGAIELLSAAERRLFDRLSVFAGGLSLEAAEAVCSGDGIAESELVDVLAGLVDKSLVIVEPGDYRVARYTVLETLRQFGTERLAASGEASADPPASRAVLCCAGGVRGIRTLRARPARMDRSARA